MPREITDRGRVVEAIQNLALTAELFEEQNGKQKYATDLEVIVQGRDYANGKRVGPYVRLLTYDSGEEIMRQGEWGGNTFYIAVEGTLDVYVRDAGGQKKIGQLEPGTCFGEMALLAGIERNATVSVPANQTALVLEVTRPALRLLRKLSNLRQHPRCDLSRSRRRSLDRRSPTRHRQAVKPTARGRAAPHRAVHGLRQESRSVQRRRCDRSSDSDQERLGATFARRAFSMLRRPEVVLGMDEGIGVDFLGGGNCLGSEGVTQPNVWKYRASVMARTEVLEVPLDLFSTDPELRKQLSETFSGLRNPRHVRYRPRSKQLPDLNALKAAEEEITTGITDGTNVLVMDMDLCIRCGNCSLACHKMHGQSRLLRRGIQIERPAKIGKKRLQHALVPQVCMHCADPECLTGCPTGSIFRDPVGHVDIDPHTCIGCFDCATQCPYDAITMVPRTEPPPQNGFRFETAKSFQPAE